MIQAIIEGVLNMGIFNELAYYYRTIEYQSV